MEKQIFDILIIGAGPAGLSAATYASRSNLKTGIISGGAPGGKVNTASKIANYPGYEEIDGASLAYKLYEPVSKMNVDFISANVIEVRKEDELFLVISDGGTFYSYSLIIATGTANKTLSIPGEKDFLGKGLSYCATCDGFFFKNKDVAVVGGNSHAFEETLYLANICKKVFLIYEKSIGDELLLAKIKESNNIEVLNGYKPISINGEDKITSISIANEKKETKEIYVSGVFPFIGEKTTLDFLHFFKIDNKNGFIIVNNLLGTNIPGLFAAGDVTDTPLRQIVTAVSDGAIASTSAIKYVKGIKK